MSTLQDLQRCELEMLKEFIHICDKLNLNYYLLGGTLLGAVRHQGFIPWDDDIDIGMCRQDYERFLKEGQEHLPEYYFIQTYRTDPQWPANFAKIRDSRTTFIESSVSGQNINHGVYIDIFPLDHYTTDSSIQKVFERKNRMMVRRISLVFRETSQENQVPLFRRLARVALKVVSCLRYPTLKSALVAREKLFLSVCPGGMLANHCGAWGKKEIIPSEWYGNGVTLTFEELSVNAPTQYERWLTQVYGNYMQLPPVEKRVAHHYCDVIDLSMPYTEYTRKEKKS